MKQKLFLLLCISLLCTVLMPADALAQACTGLQVTYTATESRCMSTGTISVQVTGGSGSYNYKAEGPVTTAFTSSSTLTGLSAGTYRILVKDINKDCIEEITNVVVSGSYQDPRFTLTHTNVSCARNDGTISVTGLQYGRSPFNYTIVAPSPAAHVGTTSTSGVFTNLVAGEYAIQLKDSCGGIQVRRITIEDYSWNLEGASVNRINCHMVQVQLQAKDNRGHVNTSSDAFTGFQYGVVNQSGDTTWHATSSFQYELGTRRYLTLVAKDPCGRVHTRNWSVPDSEKPSIDKININNSTCSTFTANVSGQKNLTNPQYNLYRNGSLEVTNTTGSFSNLPYGTYSLEVADVCYDTIIKMSVTATAPVPALNAPTISNRSCSTFTASVTASNFTPTEFCLYDRATGKLIRCSNTGTFDNLDYGSYCIKATDPCSGNMAERCFEEKQPLPQLNVPTITSNCTTFTVSVKGSNLGGAQYCLYDSEGRLVACNNTGEFTGIPHGSYCIRATVCGVTSNERCFTTAPATPTVDANVQIRNLQCATFTAAITGQRNLTNPLFELINDVTKEVVASNNTGVFDNVPYGSRYCILIKDGCTAAVLERCFTQAQPQPAVNPTMQQSNITCNTFTATITGSYLSNAQYCLYNAANELVACNSTGIFPNLPYGAYCAVVTDGCTGKTFTICQTFALNYSMSLTTSKTCAIGEGTVTATFANGFAPHTVQVYRPDGTLHESKTTTTNSTSFTLPALPAGQVYTITASDNCGRADSKTIAPDATTVTRKVTVTSKCPSAAWQNGSGSLQVVSSSNNGSVTPRIISKNGASWARSYSSSSGSSYTFSDLEPATYVIEYSLAGCNTKLYDTETIKPYAFPTQGQSAIYQCDNNSFSLNADVTGGLGPYNYQIIGSDPDTPSIVTAEQSSPVFHINSGTTYSLIRLRTIDACGNATLSDVSVLPLQNVIMKASRDCFYNEVTLSVDTIPNATYAWYKKTGRDDSVLLTTDLTYNLPYMMPEDAGTYVCKITINEGCITRLTSYTLDGDCGHVSLPTALHLSGKRTSQGHVLSWQGGDKAATAYILERKGAYDSSFTTITTLPAQVNGKGYSYTDAGRHSSTLYRVKWTTAGGKKGYSNMVHLHGQVAAPVVYPNPATSELHVALSGSTPATYQLSLHNVAGQAVYKTELKSVTTTLFRYNRSAQVPNGLYLLQIVNVSTGDITQHKILFK